MVDLTPGDIEAPQARQRHVCLIAEDEALLATLLEMEFTQAGFETVIVSRTIEAVAWLSERTPDVAVIDTMLVDGSSAVLARTLVDGRVPFIVHTGSDPTHPHTDEAFRASQWLIKPVSPALLVEAALRIVAARV